MKEIFPLVACFRGVRIFHEGYHLLLDPQRRTFEKDVNLVLVSHAHSDHSSGVFSASIKTPVVLNEATKKLIEAVSSRKIKNYKTLRESESLVLNDDLTLEACRAGHILGSLQYRIDFKDGSVAYTGDINFYKTILQPGCSIIRGVDVLIIESTYGHPNFVFPPREEVYMEALDWIEEQVAKGFLVILGGYELGKGQELTALVTRGLNEKPYVSAKIFRFNRIYEEHGVTLGEYRQFYTGMDLKNVNIIISSHFSINNLRRKIGKRRKIKAAVFTGLVADKKYIHLFTTKYGCDACFPLSSHSDFKGLIEYISCVQPKTVYTVHGRHKQFAKAIKKELGLEAKPLENIKIDKHRIFK
ncbi:MAG: hypothetical protein J7L38_03375 [Thermoproteales archaeon]|nr:hypothetical protein [Thermoproteales archaeon]